MTLGTAFASTPCYVLKNGSQPISATTHPDNKKCTCVYGFSDKPVYDQFIKNADELLTPYPLVIGYLSNQIEASESTDDDLLLVLAAATMETVLAAKKNKEEQVSVEFELTFDAGTNSYRLG
jgi:Fic family protein